MSLTVCSRCSGEVWIGSLEAPCCERELFVRCCSGCGVFDVVPPEQEQEAREFASMLDHDMHRDVP